jgi:hypothetical protein
VGSQEYFFIKTIKITKRADLKNHLLFDNIDLTIYSENKRLAAHSLKVALLCICYNIIGEFISCLKPMTAYYKLKLPAAALYATIKDKAATTLAEHFHT